MWAEQAVLVQMSEGKFTSLGALGAGLLTGTALAVILPEGFHAFQAAQDATGEHPIFSKSEVAHILASLALSLMLEWASQTGCSLYLSSFLQDSILWLVGCLL